MVKNAYTFIYIYIYIYIYTYIRENSLCCGMQKLVECKYKKSCLGGDSLWRHAKNLPKFTPYSSQATVIYYICCPLSEVINN